MSASRRRGPRSDAKAPDSILVVGATSGIGVALCHRLAQDGARLVLAGRNTDQLAAIAADLMIRYRIQVATEPFEALAFDQHAAFVERCLGHVDGCFDGAVVCHGYLPDAERSRTDLAEVHRAIDINLTSVASVLTPIATCMETRGRGWIAVISSVAGDRGRQSNYVYGSAKGGLSVFLQGLRNRLSPHGVNVLTVKPGFVDTAMLHGVDPASPLVASPERVAADVHRAIQRRRHQLYTPWFWRPVMFTIRHVPEFIFKRLKL